MRIVHIESGLGNQMLSYCEYLALKKIHGEQDLFIETIVYDIPEANDFICQWNGYELEKIFGIKAKNIIELFSNDNWNKLIREIELTRFWNKNWNYPIYFTQVFKKNGLNINNIRGNFEESSFIVNEDKLSFKIKQTGFYSYIKRLYQKNNNYKAIKLDVEHLFYQGKEDIFTGQRLSFKKKGNAIEKIDKEIRESFKFPPYTDKNNINACDKIKNCNAVAIHARRGDMLSCNGKYYKSGYFKRAVKYIKKNVENPEFFFFCDPGSIEWCKQNEKIFGLDFKKDKVHFVEWNKGESSFRDMQLMTECKHNIITNSSFGWWGAYLNTNPNKITISPEIEINTTHHF